MPMLDHPLTNQSRARKEHRAPTAEEAATDHIVIINRPRFTPAEALILNLLVNRHPDYVRIDDVVKYISPVTYGYPRQTTIEQHLVHLRAKLGEKLRQPTQIVTVRRWYRNRFGRMTRRVIGWRWVEPGEQYNPDLDENEATDA